MLNFRPDDRYNILEPNVTKNVEDEKKASANLLEAVKLDENLFRLGHTKARLFKTNRSIRQ